MNGSIDKLAAALVAFQGDLEAVEKNAANPFFKSKYADLPQVKKAVQPLLKKHELAVSQFITNLDGQSALRTILLHKSGQCIEDTMPLLLSKDDPQGQGSAISYARRYSFMSVLGIVADEDDDANRASSKPAPRVPKQTERASEKQLQLIRGLLVQLGTAKEQRDAIVVQVASKNQASELIEELQHRIEKKKNELEEAA